MNKANPWNIGAVRSPAKFAVLLLLIGAAVPPTHATWSIVMADSRTKEVAVGTVTCLNNYDLLDLVPVIVVGKGAGACQASGDFDGLRRPIMFDQLLLGTPPEQILDMLSVVTGHTSRQYGLADTQGRMVTFTGSATFEWHGGVVGSDGTLVYAIQGNILAGGCVVPAIEQALLSTPGDIPAKLMAGMEAARTAGGDGRCSCGAGAPMDCGCPPEAFDKAGHIGGMVVARIGDTDDPICDVDGCTDGDYFMRLDVAFQPSDAVDPVLQLADLFAAWRAALTGRPDAIQSEATVEPAPIPPDGLATATLHIALHDWAGSAITTPIQTLVVTHAADSAGQSSIGPLSDLGGGQFAVTLTAGQRPGIDRFTITVDDGIRPVILMPETALQYFPFGDLNCDGAFNGYDIDPFVLALVSPTGYSAAYAGCSRALADLNHDGEINGYDIDPFVLLLTHDCNHNGILDAQDIADGTSADCNGNDTPDECDLASGLSSDCNANQIPDECDIAGGASLDCNANAVPDECDIASGASQDCNGNGIPDECDLAAGTSQDCQPNGIPDECDMAPPTYTAAHDECAAAELICPGHLIHGTTSAATNDGSASCGSSGTSPDVWYFYQPVGSGFAMISLCGSAYDTVLSVHSACPGTPDNQIVCNDNYCDLQSYLSFYVLNGHQYWIRVSGNDGAVGDFQITLTGPACNFDGDCNDNGVPDDCDIAAGTSLDLDGDGVPDECE
jgi:uncharacterized Ntn-hydrolase superfamily protein